MSTTNNSKVTIANHLFRGENVKGEIGVEVEVEGTGLPTGEMKNWNVTRDGSLRGEAYEYVFKSPISRENVPNAISELYKALSKAKVIDSGRAGVHVHVNIRDLDAQELFSFILLYVVFENVLIEMCGEDRKGNLFCLRADDAEYLLIKMTELFKTIDFSTVATDRIRYSGVNLTAIRKYGSLEFRSLPSPVAEDKLNLWVNLLLKLKDKARELKDPRLIVAGVSEYGGRDFAVGVFGDLLDSIPCEDWNRAVIKGMRKIQPIVPLVNFELIQRIEKKLLADAEKPKLKTPKALLDIGIGAIDPADLAGMIRAREPTIVNQDIVLRGFDLEALQDRDGVNIDFPVFAHFLPPQARG
jgi:hypothetical protein